MSVTSTRKVSTSMSYSSPAKGAYEAAAGHQSFVETIDTTNNISVTDKQSSGSGRQFKPSAQDDENFTPEVQSNQSNELKPSSHVAPLWDNDDDQISVHQNKSVGIYGANQEMSETEDEKPNNPYLRYFYENNEIIEDIDEFV